MRTAKEAPVGVERTALPLTALAGVGPARAARLARLGVRTVRDLLLLVPRKLDRVGARAAIREARERAGAEVVVAGKVERQSLWRRGRRQTVLRVKIGDGSGTIDALFFNQPWLRERLRVGAAVELAGRVHERDGPVLLAPRLAGASAAGAPLEPGSIVPIYPLVHGLGQGFLRALAADAARRFADALEEPLPADVLAALDLVPLGRAARALHEPSDAEAFERARRRLAFESILTLQARLFERRAARVGGRALACKSRARAHAARLAALPHVPTPGQREVLAALRADLASRTPMRRLLQGDVGAGKTLCGLYAALAVAGAGGQTALLAPTELLAEQHFYGLAPLLARAGLRAELVTGSRPRDERRDAMRALAAGEIAVAFGTHALFSDEVRYARLALAIVDEQHRFGVSQRRRLFDKGRDVHALLMTATPIPRTLALTVYGDLDTSVLAGAPPGRGTLTTKWLRGPLAPLRTFLEERLAAGERAFWVCPRIDSSSAGRGAEEAHAALAAGPLGRFGVELVHGRLSSEARVRALDRFRAGDAGLLVGTTVIEVGVDVPEATAIVVEGAERLGLAQLHQLRGRVGRGPRDAWCVFVGAAAAAPRLELLERTRDGFAIAEEDLRQRGMGDLLGLRQAGANDEGLGDADVDLELLVFARDLVARDAALRARYAAGAASDTAP